MPSRIVALWCWYYGGPFRGYQSQPQGPTVQDTLREGLRKAGFEHMPVAAGRTDLGVHARMQVLTLRVAEHLPTASIAERVNAQLPPTLGIACAKDVPSNFHAQWSASGKEYRYRLLLADNLKWHDFAWRVEAKVERLRELLPTVVGTHDYWAFHEASSARRERTVESATCTEVDAHGVVELTLTAPGFARYMVRYLVGGLVGVAMGKLREDVFVNALKSGERFSGIRSPPQGLVLWSVRYPAEIDPFSARERAVANGVPAAPPFAF